MLRRVLHQCAPTWGKQKHTFKAGVHTIAVKVMDDEGLESIETIKLKVNGVVKKV